MLNWMLRLMMGQPVERTWKPAPLGATFMLSRHYPDPSDLSVWITYLIGSISSMDAAEWV